MCQGLRSLWENLHYLSQSNYAKLEKHKTFKSLQFATVLPDWVGSLSINKSYGEWFSPSFICHIDHLSILDLWVTRLFTFTGMTFFYINPFSLTFWKKTLALLLGFLGLFFFLFFLPGVFCFAIPSTSFWKVKIKGRSLPRWQQNGADDYFILQVLLH